MTPIGGTGQNLGGDIWRGMIQHAVDEHHRRLGEHDDLHEIHAEALTKLRETFASFKAHLALVTLLGSLAGGGLVAAILHFF